MSTDDTTPTKVNMGLICRFSEETLGVIDEVVKYLDTIGQESTTLLDLTDKTSSAFNGYIKSVSAFFDTYMDVVHQLDGEQRAIKEIATAASSGISADKQEAMETAANSALAANDKLQAIVFSLFGNKMVEEMRTLPRIQADSQLKSEIDAAQKSALAAAAGFLPMVGPVVGFIVSYLLSRGSPNNQRVMSDEIKRLDTFLLNLSEVNDGVLETTEVLRGQLDSSRSRQSLLDSLRGEA